MEPPNDMVDAEELLRQIGLGNSASLAAFYERFSGLIYSTALRVLGDASDAEDVTQEVFFMIWEKAPMYDTSRGKALTWAITMTRNKSIDRLRSQQRRFRLNDEVQKEAGNDLTAEREPFDGLDQAEQGHLIRSAVMKLSEEQRVAIEMAYFGGLTQQEIASRLQQPIGTVKARIRRGVGRLRKIIGSAI